MLKGKSFQLFAVLLVMVMLLFGIVTGCDSPDSDDPAEPGEPDEIDYSLLVIGTGGVGGVYYPYSGGLATIINRNLEGVNAAPLVGGSSVESTNMVTFGTAHLALIMNDVGYQAYNGIGRFDDEDGERPIRTLFQIYPHHFHVVVLDDTPVYDIEDISGMTVSVGAPGSGTEFKADMVLTTLGISYDEFEVVRLPFAETGEDLRDGRIDVGIWDVAAPVSSVFEITATRDIRVIPFTEEQIAAIVAEHPYYSAFELPAGTYPGQDEPILNPSVWNSVICRDDFPEELAYEIVKVIFENQQHLIDIHHFAEWTTPQNALDHSTFPMHPGAIRYYQEIGLEVPEHLIPPEME